MTTHRGPPRPSELSARQQELLRLWRWRGALWLFSALFVLGFGLVLLLVPSRAAPALWALVFLFPLAPALAVLRLAECPWCDARLGRPNPLRALVGQTCPHCAGSLAPGGDPGRID